MSENHLIISQARGEPRSLGDIGVRVRVQLSGFPSRRWAVDLCARLTTELTGYPGAAHLRVNVNELVQGNEIVLEGVEDRDAPTLAGALRRAVDATNQTKIDQPTSRPNVTQREADRVASHMRLSDSSVSAATGAGPDPRGLSCGAAGERWRASGSDELSSLQGISD